MNTGRHAAQNEGENTIVEIHSLSVLARDVSFPLSICILFKKYHYADISYNY